MRNFTICVSALVKRLAGVFLSKLVNSLRNPNKRTPQRESYSNIMKQNCPANNELQPTPVKKAEPQNTTKSKPRKTKNNTAIIATSQHEDETSNDTNSEEKELLKPNKNKNTDTNSCSSKYRANTFLDSCRKS